MSINKNFCTIVLTSIITAIFTFISGYFLQREHEKYEYQYWKNKFIIEQAKQNINDKIQICDKINTAFLKLSHAVIIMKTESELYKKCGGDNYDSVKTFDAIYNYFQELFVLNLELQKVVIYFPKDVIDVVEKNSKTLSSLYERNNALVTSELQEDAFINIEELDEYRCEIILAIMNDIRNSGQQIGMILSD